MANIYWTDISDNQIDSSLIFHFRNYCKYRDNDLEAKRMDATVKPNNITLEDVVVEVKKIQKTLDN